MQINKLLRLLTPPIIRRLTTYRSPIYDTYDAACAAATPGGYTDPDIVRVIASTNGRCDVVASWQIIAAGLVAQYKGAQVLDFGAGSTWSARAIDSVTCAIGSATDLGASYYRFDTPELAMAMGEQFIPWETVAQATYEIAIAAGSLQYTSDPVAWLCRLLRLNAPYVLIARHGMPSEAQCMIWGVQRRRLRHVAPLPAGVADKEIRLPVGFMPRPLFERIINQEGYRVIAAVNEDRVIEQIGKHEIYEWTYLLARA